MYREGNGGYGRNTSIAMGGLSGSLASAFTSIALGDDDNKVAKNIYAGNFVGTNAAANNSTLIDKSGKILKVDENDGDTGVYVDNGNGTKTWVAATPEPGSLKGGTRIRFDTTIDIDGMAEALADEKTQLGLANDFRTNHELDLKAALISMEYTDNPMDGIIRKSDGMIIPVRSAGNQLYGQAVGRNGYPLTPSMKAAGTYQQTQNRITSLAVGGLSMITDSIVDNGLVGYGNAPYWGEETGTGKDILTGYQGSQYPVQRTENYSGVKDIIEHYINIKK
jgi:hypothetical protein